MPLPRRFDNALMQAPAPDGPIDATLLAALRAWCEAGAFRAPFEPLRVAAIAPHPGLDAVAGVLDGSQQLARLGRWQGLAWRLQLQWRERMAGRPARPEDPWDCGWWRDGALEAAAAFQPRRPTLLMLREPAADTLSALLERLHAGAPTYRRPLRVLVVSSTAPAGVQRI